MERKENGVTDDYTLWVHKDDKNYPSHFFLSTPFLLKILLDNH